MTYIQDVYFIINVVSGYDTSVKREKGVWEESMKIFSKKD